MTETAALSLTAILAVVLGVTATALSEWARIPAIVPLLLAGMALGPWGAGWVDPALLGQGLPVVVGLSIAIILFEGGLNLDIPTLRALQASIGRLLTLGAVLTWVGGALAARALLGFAWSSAFLFGSLVIVTGPTVILPLLARVPLQPRLHRILESEGVLIAPIGALAAVFTHDLFFAGGSALGGPTHLLGRLAVGVIMGGVVGGVLVFLARRGLAGSEETQVLVFLAGALAAYGFSQALLHGSGLVAATLAGIVVGNGNIPRVAELKRFKGQLSVLVIGVLFVLLAATLDPEEIRGLGWRGLGVVAILLLAVRPLAIFLCTAGSGLGLREKLFLSWVAPRGIIAASMASLFAMELRATGVREAGAIEGLVYLTIAISVVVQGITARPLSKLLKVSAGRTGVVIIGANALGRLLGRVLQESGREVGLIDSNEWLCARAREEGLAAMAGNALDAATLERVGTPGAGALVAVTANPAVNALACQMAREEFRVAERVALLTREGKGVDRESLARIGARPAFAGPLDAGRWSARIEAGECRLIAIAMDAAGEEIGSLAFPDNAIPLALRRGSQVVIATAGERIQAGDQLSVLVAGELPAGAIPGSVVEEREAGV
ncbi:MAG: hypothetical protein A2Y95_13170 [Deltaproteobacteria bacterium RBG_13_65_10]|nr:MAG: hypothetical protein A2Y95_13170 [Deltaproteobacteria bacterium RBG_13_65_10]